MYALIRPYLEIMKSQLISLVKLTADCSLLKTKGEIIHTATDAVMYSSYLEGGKVKRCC